MKASEILKGALASHYVRSSWQIHCGRDQSEYMCSAIDYYLQSMGHFCNSATHNELYFKAKATFMPTLQTEDTICLTVYLKLTNKRYAYYVRDFGYDSKACYNARLKWWSALIEQLEFDGL